MCTFCLWLNFSNDSGKDDGNVADSKRDQTENRLDFSYTRLNLIQSGGWEIIISLILAQLMNWTSIYKLLNLLILRT